MSDSRPKIHRNPFAQPEGLWQAEFRVPIERVLPVEEAFDGEALAVLSFEDPADPDFWTVQVLLAREPNGVPLPEAFDVRRIRREDWQHSLERDFPPFFVGRFFIHGAHARAVRPPHAVGLQVEAGMAFGSGEHATTSGCLLAIMQLAKRRVFLHVLDMGCGSGILAVAAAKSWPCARVLAVDVDPVSARIARENMRINRVGRRVKVMTGDGYKAAAVRRGGPYDLILANILARPLVAFSRALAENLAPGGVAVLSGLLASQAPMVLAAHRRQGLRLQARIASQGWTTLMMAK